MNHHTVALAMCRITEELLWKPRMGWAAKHNPTARLTIRVGSGKKTYLSHPRDVAENAHMTLTYGVKMVADKSDPTYICKWLTSREVHERGYYGGQINLLNVLAHTMAHEFGHFVQVILGRRYDGSVHNQEFYVILDRIHASGEGDKIRDALHQSCLLYGIDLSKITASQEGLNILAGKLPNGEKPLGMREIYRHQKLWFRDPTMHSVGPVRVKEKRRTKIVVETVEEPKRRWVGYPAGFTTTQP
ncbi:hypothetical protein ACEPU1_29435 [Pseudomonas aeruginosa]|jgi:hypothetical protein